MAYVIFVLKKWLGNEAPRSCTVHLTKTYGVTDTKPRFKAGLPLVRVLKNDDLSIITKKTDEEINQKLQRQHRGEEHHVTYQTREFPIFFFFDDECAITK